MWFPDEDRRIYTDAQGRAHDPLDVRQRLVLESGGLVWALMQKRRACYVALQDPADVGAEAQAETELAGLERQLCGMARKVFEMPSDVPARAQGVRGVYTDDEALAALDHYVGWLAAKKASTAASPES